MPNTKSLIKTLLEILIHLIHVLKEDRIFEKCLYQERKYEARERFPLRVSVLNSIQGFKSKCQKSSFVTVFESIFIFEINDTVHSS